MSKMVTYGCSYTAYTWSTWADILAENLDLKLINRGLRGAGNNFISARLNYDIKSGLIEKDDVIRIMWCYYNRIVDFNNLEECNYRVPTRKKSDMVKNFHTNLDIMLQCQDILKDYDYEFMLWLPFTQDYVTPGDTHVTPNEIENFPWQEKFEKPIHPPLIDIVMQGRLDSRIDYAIWDIYCPPLGLRKNVKKLAKKQGNSPLELIRDQIKLGDTRFNIFFDYHPTPLMHLEYLQAIYPQMTWKTALVDKIHRENQEVLNTFW